MRSENGLKLESRTLERASYQNEEDVSEYGTWSDLQATIK